MSDATPLTCHVCGETLGDETAVCIVCDRTFHLRATEASDAKDCGDVWISEQHLSLEFACNVCLGHQVDPEPPVARGH